MYLYLINKPFQNAMYYLSVLSVKLLFLEVKSAEKFRHQLHGKLC